MRLCRNAASAHDHTASGLALALVVSMLDGRVVHHVGSPSDPHTFGYAVAGGGDLDGDGAPEFLVATYQDVFTLSSGGGCRVYSGASGKLLRHRPGGPFSGRSAPFVGDVDGNGISDYAAGTTWDLSGAFEPGRVLVFSGRSGAELLSVPPGP